MNATLTPDFPKPFHIILGGLATLFIELTLIRYIPGQIRVLGYFTNFVLLAAFLGFGIGLLCSKRWPERYQISFYTPISLLIIVCIAELGRFFNVIPSSEQFLFLEYQTMNPFIPLFPFLTLSFILLAITFVPIGFFVGITLSGDRPLWRYALNVAGSLLGIGLFVIIQFITVKPYIWMLAAAIISYMTLSRASKNWRFVGIITALCLAAITYISTQQDIWSPYQKITTAPVNLIAGSRMVHEWEIPFLKNEEKSKLFQLPESSGLTIRVNDDSYQYPMNLSAKSIVKFPELKSLQVQFNLPFTIWKTLRPRLLDQENPGDSDRKFIQEKTSPPIHHVLILGAGSGNDVAAAIRGGAEKIDAVEIDPEIVRIGRNFHPEKPYDNPRVTLHIDDARSFLSETDEKFDIIVFGMLDSHVLSSSKSNIRLDSFVFTKESFLLAKKHLTDDGLLIVSHAVGTEYFFNRMRATLKSAFGKPPVIASAFIHHPIIGIVYITGKKVISGKPLPKDLKISILEDDWPFLYLKNRKIPDDYVAAMLIMALITILAVRFTAGKTWAGMDYHFLALGCGFLLLETRGISVLMVLLGSTWQVNSAIFFGVLVMSLSATIWAYTREKKGILKFPSFYYSLLALFLGINYWIPVSDLIGLPFLSRLFIGILILSLPLFASGVIFAVSLSHTGQANRALASNIIGALLGGLMEYTSMSTGFRYLVLIAAMSYGMALLCNLNVNLEKNRGIRLP